MHSPKLLTSRYQYKITQPTFFILWPKTSRFSGAFAKLRKAAIRFVMSFSPLVREPAWNNVPTATFLRNLIFVYFWKICRENQFSLKPDKNKRVLYMKTNIHFLSSRSFLLRMKNVSDKNCREKHNTHFTVNNFFRKSYRL